MKNFLINLSIGIGLFLLLNVTGTPGGLKMAYAADDTLVIPEACVASAQEFENTCYSANDVSFTEQVSALRKIKSCLKREGFADDKIKQTLILIKEKVNAQSNRELSKR